MERKSNSGEWEKMKKEIHELMTEGIDYAHQLKSQLGSSSSDLESREHLAKKILESYHKSLTIMNHSGELEQVSPHIHGGGSPKSDDSDQEHHQTITRYLYVYELKKYCIVFLKFLNLDNVTTRILAKHKPLKLLYVSFYLCNFFAYINS